MLPISSPAREGTKDDRLTEAASEGDPHSPPGGVELVLFWNGASVFGVPGQGVAGQGNGRFKLQAEGTQRQDQAADRVQLHSGAVDAPLLGRKC